MTHKKFVGTFHSIDTVLYKVVELKNKGYSENSIYAFSHEQDNISMLRDQTGMELHGAYGENWHDGLNELLGFDKSGRNAFKMLGFSDEEAAHYYDEVENGGVALFTELNGDNLVDADSSAEIGRSGERLDGGEDNELSVDNDVTTPRLKTDYL